MPLENGIYVAPEGGWVNDTNPAINATEMNAISTTLECVKIANGGTGGTTKPTARNNLGFAASGSANTPVYFKSNGLPTPMTGSLPVELGGTGSSTAAGARERLGFGNAGNSSTPVYFQNGLPTPITGTLSIENGGTGASTATQARNNLDFGATGNANVPVYFNSSGLPQAMSGELPINLGGSGMAGTTKVKESDNKNSVLYRWGKIAMWYFVSTDPLVDVRKMTEYIPTSLCPANYVHAMVPGVIRSSSTGNLPPLIYYNLTIVPNFDAQGNVAGPSTVYMMAPHGNTSSYYPRFAITWLIA